MPDFQVLAAEAYSYAEKHYGDKGARFDVIVECFSMADIARELESAGADSSAKAIKWCKGLAGAQHEQELNQAWDGPESVRSSPMYDPEHDPGYMPEDDADPEPSLWLGPEFADDVSLEERWEHYAFEERNGMAYGSSF